MASSSVRRLRVAHWVVLASLALAGCGSNLDGTYHDANGAVTLDIKSSKARLTMMGETHELSYKVDGDKITLHDPKEAAQGDIVLTRNGDGTLSGPMGTLTKK